MAKEKQAKTNLEGLLKTIQTGKIVKPPRLLLYGQEGIGKSTFAANFPQAIFIQTEDGLDNIDCAKFPLCNCFDEVLDDLDALNTCANDFKTVVIDSVDWLERLIWDAVCKEYKVKSIESIGYGRGYVIALNYWREFLERLTTAHNGGKIVLMLAHAVTEDYTDAEVVNLKRFTPRLHKTAKSLISEYVDAILLATRENGSANGSDNNNRIVRTDASPQQVAKSRYRIPDGLPLDANIVLKAIRDSIK